MKGDPSFDIIEETFYKKKRADLFLKRFKKLRKDNFRFRWGNINNLYVKEVN